MKRLFLAVLFVVLLNAPASAAERSVPARPEVVKLKMEFNGEPLKGYYLLIDARTAEEKEKNAREKKIEGSVIVFFHGHAQRPGDAYRLTSRLALKSMSGMAIVPVCDTPYGRDPRLRGDDGKDVLLMEMVRHVLSGMGIIVDGYRPLTTASVTINGKAMVEDPASSDGVRVKLMSTGWSHGGLLARRFAHAHGNCVTDLAHFCPAGYTEWGNESCYGPSCLLGNFTWECMRISTDIFKHPGEVMGTGWGITKGVAGDSFRSCGSCFGGNIHVCKPFRGMRDLRDCTRYYAGNSLTLKNLRNVVVVFAESDTVFDVKEHGIAGNREEPDAAELERFWEKYYPEEVKAGTRLTFRVLKGKHIAPVIYHDRYADTALEYSGQLLAPAVP